jgi:hypothetical protein
VTDAAHCCCPPLVSRVFRLYFPHPASPRLTLLLHGFCCTLLLPTSESMLHVPPPPSCNASVSLCLCLRPSASVCNYLQVDGLPQSGFLTNGTDVDQYFFDFLPGYANVELSFDIIGGSPLVYGALGGRLPSPSNSDFQVFSSGALVIANTDPMFTSNCGTSITTVCRFNLLVRNAGSTVVCVCVSLGGGVGGGEGRGCTLACVCAYVCVLGREECVCSGDSLGCVRVSVLGGRRKETKCEV